MPYTIEWAVPDRVVLSRAFGQFTVEDIKDIMGAINSYTSQSEAAIVHVVMDTTELDGFPTTVPAVRQALSGSKVSYYGWSMIVTQSPLVRLLVAAATTVTNARFRTVPTLEAAYRFLEQDDTLDLSALAKLEETAEQTPT